MSVRDVPWLLAAAALTAVGGWLVWFGLTQLGAGGNGAVAVVAYLFALDAGAFFFVGGLLALTMYATRDRRR